jgi:hypothetical protein
LGWLPIAVVQYTFTQKKYTEQHNETEYTEQKTYKNKNNKNNKSKYITIRIVHKNKNNTKQ